jgi:hypothetical protein
MKTNKEKDIWAMFNELNSMLYEVMGDFNKAWAENIELKKEVDWFKKYTDALVEHKDMVCLPADLRNLREANDALAAENEELKKKVKELTRPEPTEEELNSLFMDKQVDPKDIEFEAEMLVKSVQDYADSLNNTPKLKSLEEHNNSKLNIVYGVKTGLACPKCGNELHYTNPSMMLTSYPPKREVRCSNCKHIDYVY